MVQSDYTFRNLFGGVFSGGAVAFSNDGNVLLTSFGNRVCLFDLINHTSICLPCESRRNVSHILVDPFEEAKTLIVIDCSGYCIVFGLPSCVLLHSFQLKSTSTRPEFRITKGNNPFCSEFVNAVQHAAYSPNGEYIGVAVGKKLQVWHRPCERYCWHLILKNEYQHHLDVVDHFDWSSDSKYIITASRDMTCRLYSVLEKILPVVFIDHRSPVIGAFFLKNSTEIFTVSSEGVILLWKWVTHNKSFKSDDSIPDEDIIRARIFPSYIPFNTNEKESNDREFSDKSVLGKSLTDVNIMDLSSGSWTVSHKSFYKFGRRGNICSAAFSKTCSVLVICTTFGSFSIYKYPSMQLYITLSLISGSSDTQISSVCFNFDGKWIAMGAAESGTLVVWEWESETYIMRQDGHNNGIRCCAFCSSTRTALTIGSKATDQLDSHTGSNFKASGGSAVGNFSGSGMRGILGTGGSDGKVKLWDAVSGYCFVTFSSHTSACTDIVFTPQGNAVLSASLDGTVKAYDLMRYRNFRTFSADSGTFAQFDSLAVDSGGELVVAAATSINDNCVYVWSIQTGKLLEKLSGHESAISGVAFHPHPKYGGYLASGSWDGTIRVWNLYSRSKGGDAIVLRHSSDVVALDFDPRGNGVLAVATLAGNINFWDVDDSHVTGSIDGLRDIFCGRTVSDKRSMHSMFSKKRSQTEGNPEIDRNRYFSCIRHVPSGHLLLAVSKFSCRVYLYDTDLYTLQQSVQITHNQSIDGLRVELNSRFITESGVSIKEYDVSDPANETTGRQYVDRKKDESLPGVMYGELQSDIRKKMFIVWKVACSSDSSQWAVASSHGLFLYSMSFTGYTPYSSSLDIKQMLQSTTKFFTTPRWLTQMVTIPNIHKALLENNYSKAFVLSLALNDISWMSKVYESVPFTNIPIVVQSVAPPLLPNLLTLLLFFLKPSSESIAGINDATNSASPHIQLHLTWLQAIFFVHMGFFQGSSAPTLGTNSESTLSAKSPSIEWVSVPVSMYLIRKLLLMLLQYVTELHSYLGRLYSCNLYRVMYLRRAPS